MNETIALAIELLKRPSITPADGTCQHFIASYLENLGFHITHLPAGPVSNLWAEYGHEGPLLVFAGHTDVVDVGNLDDWTFPPFTPTIQGNWLYGRGAQDMKGSIAAMMSAAQRFLAKKPTMHGRIGFLITSAEEGPDYPHGTPKVIEYLEKENKKITWCIVGEPSSHTKLGDVVKIGRRGSYKVFMKIKGKQGHVAYPERAKNPIHALAGFLKTLTETQWCCGNAHFSPTTMQVSYINSNTRAMNVIPGIVELWIAFRNSPEIGHQAIREKLHQMITAHQLDIDWQDELSGIPFLTPPGKLIATVNNVIHSSLGYFPECSTTGGTSDARFIAPTGAEVVEIGPCNDSIHQINEKVNIEELQSLSSIYEKIIEDLLVM